MDWALGPERMCGPGTRGEAMLARPPARPLVTASAAAAAAAMVGEVVVVGDGGLN